MKRFITALLFLLLIYSHSAAQEERRASINTVAGKLTILSWMGTLDCALKLGQKTILKYECDTSPEVLKQFKTSVSPFDEVVVFQNRMLGNACDGTDIFLIGFNKNGKYEVSASIGYCGGPAPIVTAKTGKITVTLPRHRANRGDNWIRKEVWIYEKASLRKIQ